MNWFEHALRAANPSVRWRALGLLEDVATPRRDAWLERAERDPDPRVAARAVLVSAALTLQRKHTDDLFESDFAAGELSADLEWEWEYRFIMCVGLYVPGIPRNPVWVRYEDDEAARDIALMKGSIAGDGDDVVAILVNKRFVNRYTRAPRSLLEHKAWRDHGRPRYGE